MKYDTSSSGSDPPGRPPAYTPCARDSVSGLSVGTKGLWPRQNKSKTITALSTRSVGRSYLKTATNKPSGSGSRS
jgi:hypothetical protein